MKGNIRRREINIPETPFFQPYFCQAEHIMIYTEVVSFDLNGVQIKTTVTNELKVLDEHISSFLQPTDNNRTKVIGFDMEWRPPFMLEPAIFQLCDGNSCLIFHLHPKISVPLSLRNFLRQPNYTFVGCGIKDDFEYLKKHSGIGCKNAVELGTLAATLMDKPHLGFCGVDELAFVVNKLDLHKYRPLNLAFDWDSYPLSEELAKLATVNVYSYHKIGSALFERQSYEASPLSIPLLQRSSGDESITLGPQGGLARGMSSRGPAAVSSVGGPNGYSNLSERASYIPREDLTPRYVPNRFAGPTAYDQSSAPEHSVNYGNRDLGSADRFLDRPVVNPPPARAQETALSQNTSFEKGLSEEKLQKMSMAAIKEYYSARDVNEVVLCVKDLNSPSFHPSMVYHWVTDSFERKDTERDLLAKLLIDLVKSHDGTLSQPQLIKGLESVLSTLEDFVTDAPRAPEYLGRIFAKAITEHVASLKEIGLLIRDGGEDSSSRLQFGLAADILGSTLEVIQTEKGDAFLNEIQTSSNLQLKTFRPPEPIKSRKLEKFL